MGGFKVLLAITVLAVAGAIALEPGGRQSPASGSGALVAPELNKNINAVTGFTIAAKGKTLTVQRGAAGWTLKEKDGYAVDPVAAKSLLVGLAEMKFAEPKTSKPGLYSRIDVEDVTAKDAKSRLVTVTGSGGKVLAKLIVGKTREARAGIGPGLIYFRRLGAKQAWSAAGNLSIESDPLKWLVRRLADVKRGRIRQIVLTQGDGKKTVIGRAKPGEEIKLLTTPLPDGMVAKDDGSITGLTNALSGLDFTDVRRAAKVDFKNKLAGTAELRSFDGLVVTAKVAKLGVTNFWIAFTVTFEAKDALGPTSGAAKKAGLKPADAVKKEASALAARLGGWAYKLPSIKEGYYRTRLEDLIAKKKGS
jgi:Domain of unknown function (DUF4340)